MINLESTASQRTSNSEKYWDGVAGFAKEVSVELQASYESEDSTKLPTSLLDGTLLVTMHTGEALAYALPDIKQLQQEVRKAQAIDKSVKSTNGCRHTTSKPAAPTPETTYIAGMMQTGSAGFAPVYGNWRPGIAEISEDLNEIRAQHQDHLQRSIPSYLPVPDTKLMSQQRSTLTQRSDG